MIRVYRTLGMPTQELCNQKLLNANASSVLLFIICLFVNLLLALQILGFYMRDHS